MKNNHIHLKRLAAISFVLMLCLSALPMLAPPAAAEGWTPPAGTSVWNAAADGLFSDPNNWLPVGVPAAGTHLVFNSTSIYNCTLDVTQTMGDVLMDTTFTGRIIQSIPFGMNNLTMKKGIWVGSSEWLTLYGDLIWSGGAFDKLSLKVAGIGTTVNSFINNGFTNNLWVTGDASFGTEDFYQMTVDGHMTIEPGKTVTAWLYESASITYSYQNNGVIDGLGTLRFRYYDTDRTMTFGDVRCPVELYNRNTVARKVTLAEDTSFSQLTVGVNGPMELITDGHALDIGGQITTKILCRGDSITLGSQASPDTYPALLATTLNQYVINSGESGKRTDQSQANAAYWLDALDPTIVVYLAGINDVAAGRTAGQIQYNLTVLYDMALDRGKSVVACTITPHNWIGSQYTGIDEENQVIADVNAWILSLDREGITVVDTHAAIRDPANPTKIRPGLDADGLHLNAAGCGVLASTIAPAITALLDAGVEYRLTVKANSTLDMTNSAVTVDGTSDLSGATIVSTNGTFAMSSGYSLMMPPGQSFPRLEVASDDGRTARLTMTATGTVAPTVTGLKSGTYLWYLDGVEQGELAADANGTIALSYQSTGLHELSVKPTQMTIAMDGMYQAIVIVVMLSVIGGLITMIGRFKP